MLRNISEALSVVRTYCAAIGKCSKHAARDGRHFHRMASKSPTNKLKQPERNKTTNHKTQKPTHVGSGTVFLLCGPLQCLPTCFTRRGYVTQHFRCTRKHEQQKKKKQSYPHHGWNVSFLRIPHKMTAVGHSRTCCATVGKRLCNMFHIMLNIPTELLDRKTTHNNSHSYPNHGWNVLFLCVVFWLCRLDSTS